MYDQQIKFVAQTKTVDEYGDVSIVESERNVFAEVKSIGTKEFYEAQALGLQPELKFVIADYLDYQGEKLIKFQKFGESVEKTYEIIRIYQTGFALEITARKVIE